MSQNSLTAGLEDYIEAIYIAEINNKQLKCAELARILNVSRASVSEAIARLVSRSLVVYKSYGAVKLTPIGIGEAEKVYKKHNTLKLFFETVLGINPSEASENACKIEHIISPNVLDEITKFTVYCNKYPEIIDKYREENDNETNLSDRKVFRSAAFNSKD